MSTKPSRAFALLIKSTNQVDDAFLVQELDLNQRHFLWWRNALPLGYLACAHLLRVRQNPFTFCFQTVVFTPFGVVLWDQWPKLQMHSTLIVLMTIAFTTRLTRHQNSSFCFQSGELWWRVKDSNLRLCFRTACVHLLRGHFSTQTPIPECYI